MWLVCTVYILYYLNYINNKYTTFIVVGAQQIIDELVKQSLMKKKEEEQQNLCKEASRLLALNVNNNNIPCKKRMRNKYSEE